MAEAPEVAASYLDLLFRAALFCAPALFGSRQVVHSALQLLVRHPDTGRKSHVDMTALLSSAKEAQLRPNWTRMPPCASGAHSADQRKVTWLTLLKRPAQPKAAETPTSLRRRVSVSFRPTELFQMPVRLQLQTQVGAGAGAPRRRKSAVLA